MQISDCKLLDLPKIGDERGNLSIIEQLKQIPFEIKRVHWIYDVPGGLDRGGHAYKQTEEFIVALSGSFDVEIDDGTNKRVFPLNRSYYGLYIPKGVWREIREFSTNAVALEFGSIPYSEDDYIRDYDAFCEFAKHPIEPHVVRPLPVPSHLEKKCFHVEDCSIMELDKHHSDRKGNLIYDVPGGASRGAHAHKTLEQLIVAVSGSFRVSLDDGTNKKTFFLNRPYQGLYVRPGLWRDLEDFSSGAVCMVLASEVYQAEDYIRDYDAFLEYRSRL